MAKELPYFKFEPNQWENGNIQMLSREDKGLFIDLCSMYWSRLGDVPLKLAVIKICYGDKNALNELLENNILSIKDDFIKISFLDEQLLDFAVKSKNNSENANLRWDKTPERISGNLVYVIRCWDNNEEFLKIGITKTSINRRFSGKIPYDYEALIIDFYDNIELESQYNKIAKGCEYFAKKNFSGHLECYNMSVLPKLIEFANIRNAKYVRKQNENNAIREEEIREEEKKEDKIEISLTEIKQKKFNFKSSLINYGFEKKIVEDWLLVRKNKKATNTETAFNSFIAEVESRECNINEILTECVKNSWSGFKHIWIDNLNKNNSNGKQVDDSRTSSNQGYKPAKTDREKLLRELEQDFADGNIPGDYSKRRS